MNWPVLGRIPATKLLELRAIASTSVLSTRVLERAVMISGIPCAVFGANKDRALVSKLVAWGKNHGALMFTSYSTLKLHNPHGDVSGLLVQYKGEVLVLAGTAEIRAST